MNPGGEAADTLVKMYLNGAEMMIRLSGSFLKNLLAITMALAKDHKKVSGKINLAKMLRETRDLRTFTMTPAQYKAFKKLAKKQGILFAVVTDKDDKGKVVDVILPATELDRANMLFERILYDPNLGPNSPEPPQTEKEHWWQRIFRRRDREERDPVPEQEPAPLMLESGEEREPENPTRPAPEALPEYWEEPIPDTPMEYPAPEPIPLPAQAVPLALPAPEGAERIEEPEAPKEERPKDTEETKEETSKGGENRKEPVTVLPPQPIPAPEQPTPDGPPRESGGAQPPMVQNDAPPLRPALPDTSARLPSPSKTGDSKMTSERPSVLKRLEGYRAQIEQKKEAVPEKGKEIAKGGKGVREAAKSKTPVKGVKVPKKPIR